jgi:hypothetical protein
MKIGDKNYYTYNIERNLQIELYKKYNKAGKTTEITLPDKKHINQRINLISELVGKYAVGNMIQTTRFYSIPYLDKRIKALLKFKPSDMDGKSVGDVVKSLQSRNIKVYIHGGLIRDIFLGVKSYDIDLIFDADIHKLVKVCEEDEYPCADIDIRNQNVNFGREKGASVEGANLQNTFLTQKHLHEASINDLVYDFKHNILIDLTGYGLHDCIYHILRLSPPAKYWVKWAESDFKRPLRYFKLIQKGFKPIDQEMHQFVINYIVSNYEGLYDKKIHPTAYPVTRIKHFIIKTITQGDIDTETGKYTYGPTKGKLIPYLKVLRDELPRDIFKKIMKNFTKEDLKLLKTAKIISTLQNYMTEDVDDVDDSNGDSNNDTKTKKSKVIKVKKTKKRN